MTATVSQRLSWGETELAKRGIDTARLDAEVLLAHTLGTSRVDLILERDSVIPPDAGQRFISYIKRRQKREPVAYVTGHKEFWSLDIKVNPAVLIPRPETEGIIEKALDVIARSEATKRSPKGLDILDLCTGSGCVAAALATELPHAKLSVADISPDAIEVAKRNLAFAGDRIAFFTGDLFAPFHRSPITNHQSPEFDLITANPPYISESDFTGLDEDIRRYEPREALLAGPDGLSISKRIIEEGYRYLKPGGTIIIEIGAGQAAPLLAYVKNTGKYSGLGVVKDHSGIDRFLVSGLRSQV